MTHFRMRLTLAVAVLVALVGAGNALAVSTTFVVSQVQVAGGTSADEFVELHNVSGAPLDLNGHTLVYRSAAGTSDVTITSWTTSTVVPAGGFYLVAHGAGYDGAALADRTFNLGATGSFAGAGGGLALRNGPATTGTVVDSIGYGTATNAFIEGAVAVVPAANVSQARNGGGCTDTDNNSNDFTLLNPSAPRNALSSVSLCTVVVDDPPGVSSTAPANGAVNVAVDATISVTFSEPVSTTGSWFAIQCGTSGSHTAAQSGGPTTFQLTPDTPFANGETCTVTISAAGVADQDGTPTPMAADHVFSFTTIAANPCAAAYTAIPAIQGSGLSAAITGPVTTQGVVVGDHEGASPGLRGFYLQDPTGDGNTATSDAIFIFNGGNQNLVSVGDVVRVTGNAGENQDQTQVSTSAANILVCGTGTVAPTDVTLPVASSTFLERYEGMLVRMPQTLYVTEHFQLGRFGQVVLSSGDRLYQPTTLVEPGAAAVALQAQNNLNRLILDDSSQFQNPDPIVWGRNGLPLSASNTLRGGDTITGAVGVMTYTWAGANVSGVSTNAFRLRPLNALGGSGQFVEANPRPTAGPDVGGNVQVAGMNVLNFFNTFGDDACTGGVAGEATDCRGADDAFEFARQWPKTVEAILGMGADVVGLGEIENDGYGPDSAIQFLVDRLNDATAPGTWAFVDADAGTGQVDALGADAIKVGMIYKPGVVTPVGQTAALNSVAFVNGGDGDPRNRPALAQAFMEDTSGSIFVVSANHLKSKGSACDAPDAGDGQGNCAIVRTNAATLLAQWLASDPTGTGTSRTLIVGDLNSYAKEDPIAALESAGFTNLIASHLGPNAYSYVFDGQWGYLDHALGSSSLVPHVTGVAEWHINADEPSVLDYNDDFKSPGQIASLYAPDMYRMSDHDPVVVGLQLETTFASLCELTRLYASKPGIAEALCAKLDAAAASAARGNEKSKAGQLKAFVNQVKAQAGKALTTAEAADLVRLAAAL